MAARAGSRPLLALTGARKRFGATIAVSDAGLRVWPGQVHALIGANGSGKSTLIRIITGVVRPEAGEFAWDGASLPFRPPITTLRLGIAAAYQELSLIPRLTVKDNVALSAEALGRPPVPLETLLARVREFMGIDLSPDALVTDLPQDHRRVVEILKALATSPRLLVLDEATASLDRRQVEGFFQILRDLVGAGLACIFVTHRFDEVFAIADRITVMRNGTTVNELAASEASLEHLVLEMTGQAPTRAVPQAEEIHPAVRAGASMLEVVGVRGPHLADVSLAVRAGEIVGLGGLRGHGQTELLLALYGALPIHGGEIRFGGRLIQMRSPVEAMSLGVGFVTGDRRKGALRIRPIFENFQLPSWPRYRRLLLLDLSRAFADARDMADRLALVRRSLDDPLDSLSGGNQQKVVLGRTLLTRPRLLLLDDPTVGVDVTTKADFYQVLRGLRAAGFAILLYSSDEHELVSLCDRVLVMFEGQILGELTGPELTRDRLVSASMGVMDVSPT